MSAKLTSQRRISPHEGQEGGSIGPASAAASFGWRNGCASPGEGVDSCRQRSQIGNPGQDSVIPGEDPAEFDRHLTTVENTYLPRNYVEKEIVRQIADSAWRMRRLSRIEATVMTAGIERTRVHQQTYRPERTREGHEGKLQLLGASMYGGTKFLNDLARYDGHLNRRFYRAVELMMKIRKEDRKLREAENQVQSTVLPSTEVTRKRRLLRDIAYRAWRRNAMTELVTFAFDENDRLIGVVEVPDGTLQDEELQVYIEALAKECDRFEYALKGWDRE